MAQCFKERSAGESDKSRLLLALLERDDVAADPSQRGERIDEVLVHRAERVGLFIGAGEDVYPGMILGEHNKGQDLEVNPLKGKQLTNIRAAGKDDAVRLTTPIRRTLEEALAYIEDDERVEVTPESIRLRKAILDPHERKRAKRAAQS